MATGARSRYRLLSPGQLDPVASSRALVEWRSSSRSEHLLARRASVRSG